MDITRRYKYYIFGFADNGEVVDYSKDVKLWEVTTKNIAVLIQK